MEEEPVDFLARQLYSHTTNALTALEQFINAETSSVVFCDNVTAALNAVARFVLFVSVVFFLLRIDRAKDPCLRLGRTMRWSPRIRSTARATECGRMFWSSLSEAARAIGT
jgi:hypothetical protein